jgi:hypothetical protein
MEKEFVPYEIALELKELGFDEPCFKYNNIWGLRKKDKLVSKIFHVGNPIISMNRQSYLYTDIPLYQQVFRWFREKHNITCSVSQDWHEGELLGYEGNIESIDGIVNTETFDTYEEAELECIKELIKFVK